MAGHMGSETATVRNLEVVGVDRKANVLIVKGGVPGHIGTELRITKLGVVKGYTPPPEEKEDEEEVPSDVEQMAGVTEEEARAEVPAAEVVEAVEAADAPANEEKTEEQPAEETKEDAK
jgi:large subunit ribosomal protein L3